MLALRCKLRYNVNISATEGASYMQTTQRLQRKQLCAQTQAAIAQYLQRNTIKRVAASSKSSSTSALRSKHIGRNCATRYGARV